MCNRRVQDVTQCGVTQQVPTGMLKPDVTCLSHVGMSHHHVVVLGHSKQTNRCAQASVR